MKEYLLRFRSQAFDGAMSLFKRILLPSIVLNIVMTVISLAVLVPLFIKSFNWTMADFMNFGERMREIAEDSNNSSEVIAGMFSTVNYTFFFLTMLIGLLIYCWMFYTMLKLNDNEVRYRNNSFASALAQSLSSKIFTILGYVLVYAIFYTVATVIFFFIIVTLMTLSKALGIILGFLGFIMIMIQMLRFALGFPAIVHGNMGIADAISYSFRHLTFKRALMLFLIFIIIGIAFIILSTIIAAITSAVVGDSSASITAFIIAQLFSSLASAVLGAFIYASMTALYFRYSSDETEEIDVKDHLVN